MTQLMRVFPWDNVCDLDYEHGLVGEFGAKEHSPGLNCSNLLLIVAVILPP